MSRKVGDEFERELARILNLKTTVNSGAVFDDADLRPKNGKPVIFEAKVKRNGSIVFLADTKREIEKLRKQALERYMNWVYFVKSDNEDYAVMDITTFKTMTKEYLKDES